MEYTLNIRGRLFDLSRPCVMGILNVTPDSFYAASRVQNEEAIALRARQIVSEGGAIIDVGACSTRPGSTPVSTEEEMERLRFALPIVHREAPDTPISVDTFRPEVARMVVEELGADIINDVGDPQLTPHLSSLTPHLSPHTSHLSPHTPHLSPHTPHLSPLTSHLSPLTSHLSPLTPLPSLPNVPYVLTSVMPTLRETLLFFAIRIQQLRDNSHKDIILDPGFGFGKTVEQNYALLSQMECLQVLDLPILVGVSRKSMIFRPLGITPDEALNGTTAIHAVALMKGAKILRVHDVRDAVHAIALLGMLHS